MRNLCGKRAVITGAGHGLGREIACVLAEAGVDIVVTDRDEAAAAETADIILQKGFPATSYAMDVTDVDSLSFVRDRIALECGPVDILVNNAGIVFGGPFLELDLSKHKATLDVNAFGPMAVTHTFLPGLISRPWGQIVNIASAAALIGLPYGASYAASKWAALGFSQSLREELRVSGDGHVHVTSVCPSYIQTGMFNGVKAPLFSRMLTPNYVARLITRAVQYDRELVATPWFVKLIPFFKGVLPRSWFRRLNDVLGTNRGMSLWNGHGGAAATTNRSTLLPVRRAMGESGVHSGATRKRHDKVDIA